MGRCWNVASDCSRVSFLLLLFFPQFNDVVNSSAFSHLHLKEPVASFSKHRRHLCWPKTFSSVSSDQMKCLHSASSASVLVKHTSVWLEVVPSAETGVFLGLAERSCAGLAVTVGSDPTIPDWSQSFITMFYAHETHLLPVFSLQYLTFFCFTSLALQASASLVFAESKSKRSV